MTRPLGDLYFAYPPGSEWRAGPSINLASSPDCLHWQPHIEPGIRPHAGTTATARIGGGAPPILAEIAGKRGWLTLWHGVEPKEIVGVYRTYWSLLDWSWDKKSSGYKWGAAGAVTFGCMVLSPMVAAALKKRELTLREVYVLEGSCIVPIVGGLLVNAAFDANPQWEEGAVVKVAHRKVTKRASSSAR